MKKKTLWFTFIIANLTSNWLLTNQLDDDEKNALVKTTNSMLTKRR